MSHSAAKFCPHCGAKRMPGGRFCGNCGAALDDQAMHTGTRPPPMPAGATGWQVAVGALPDARKLFHLPAPKKKEAAAEEPPAVKPAQGKSLWGSTLWMSVTQGADMVTRAMAGGGPQDAYLGLRLGIAAAVAVFGITLRSMPRLRSLLVRLGTIAMALLQGQSLLPVLKETITDPSLIGTIAPNLAAQGAGLLALLRLFQTASARVK